MTGDAKGPRRRRSPAGLRLFLLGTVAVVLVAVTGVVVADLNGPPDESPAAAPLATPARLHRLAGEPGQPGPDGDPQRSTLVLYEATGDDPQLAHENAVQAANLASRGGRWTMRPVEEYRSGDMRAHQGVIYVGLSSTNPLPPPFLADVAAGTVPVLWMGENIEQLFGAQPRKAAAYGWRPVGEDTVPAPVVSYKGRDLLRREPGEVPLERVELTARGPAQVLGTARRDDGTTTPWAVTAGALTYITEVPFSYVDNGDRYLAAADLVLRLVAPDAPERRRALIRIEDVGPNTDPEQIRRIADALSARGVPFSLATYPYYRDPRGTAHEGEAASFRLVDVPELVDALKYARQRGGTIIMHGYSHQYESLANPYDGTSGGDYEFYTAHVDAQNFVQLDGPVPADSREWAANRLAVGRAEFVRAGLPDPDIFEFPHYTASGPDYQAVNDAFGVRYDAGTYFAGQCPAGRCSTDQQIGADGLFQQYFPYPVRDVYGSVVVPENLQNVSEAYNNNPPRTVQDIVESAGAMTVVKDGVASTFFHPFLPVEQLEAVVDGIEGYGFRFVTPYEVIGETGAE